MPDLDRSRRNCCKAQPLRDGPVLRSREESGCFQRMLFCNINVVWGQLKRHHFTCFGLTLVRDFRGGYGSPDSPAARHQRPHLPRVPVRCVRNRARLGSPSTHHWDPALPILWREREALGRHRSLTLLLTDLLSSFHKAEVARAVRQTSVHTNTGMHPVRRARRAQKQEGKTAWVQLAETAPVFPVGYQGHLRQRPVVILGQL